MKLREILNEIQLNNGLTEEQWLDTDVAIEACDIAGTFKTVGATVHDARVDYKMIWDCNKGAQVLDPDYKPRILLKVTLVS